MNSLQAAITRCCLYDQNEARHHACEAQYFVEHGILGTAVQEQRKAAYHSGRALERLERLLGGAAS